MGGEVARRTANGREPDSSDANGVSGLRGPILGLLLELDRPASAYKISGLLMQRLPEWQISHSGVANLLRRLAGEGYVEVVAGATVGFRATEKGRNGLEAWMRQPLRRQTLRDEIHARIASASPHHAPLLYAAIDAYERECFALLDEEARGWEPTAPAGSWRSLTINLTRSAADETLRGHINWSKLAKRALRDWIEAHGATAVPVQPDGEQKPSLRDENGEPLRSGSHDRASA
jgi:DNA-binding PadR family transcriptional regulator